MASILSTEDAKGLDICIFIEKFYHDNVYKDMRNSIDRHRPRVPSTPATVSSSASVIAARFQHSPEIPLPLSFCLNFQFECRINNRAISAAFPEVVVFARPVVVSSVVVVRSTFLSTKIHIHMLAQKQQSQIDNNVDPQQLMRGGSDNEDNNDDDDLQFDQISMDELLSDDDSDAAPDEDLDKVLKNIQQKQLRKPGIPIFTGSASWYGAH